MSGESEKGQSFIIFALIFALTVIILSIMLNEIYGSGYSISKGLMDLPYYEVRALTHEIARAYNKGDWNFSENATLEDNLTKIFALHGYDLNLKFYNGSQYLVIKGYLRTSKVNVSFNDKKIGRFS